MSVAYQVIPYETPKLIPFSNKTIEDILNYVDAIEIEDLDIIPIAPGILIWANKKILQAQHNIAFKLDADDSLVFGKAIFTGPMEGSGDIEGLDNGQFSTIPNLIRFPNF